MNELVLNNRPDQCLQMMYRLSGVLILLLSLFVTIRAQVTTDPVSEQPYVVDGVSDTMAYGIGRSVKITGTVKNGAIALGGDVIVQGTVEGDVASIGGSIIQLEGGRIGGDVIVIGGAYRPPQNQLSSEKPNRSIVYAGYEQELRGMFRNPTELVAPQWSARYIGFRILAVLFWFVVSLVLTAILPTAISEGVTRLQLTTLRVAVIGFCGAAITGLGVLCLNYLPRPLSAIIGLLAFFLIIGATIFGRVVIYAATGRLLQRKLLPFGKNSESVALLLGTSVWTALSSVPYIWPFVFAVVIVISLGLTLTARFRLRWTRSQPV